MTKKCTNIRVVSEDTTIKELLLELRRKGLQLATQRTNPVVPIVSAAEGESAVHAWFAQTGSMVHLNGDSRITKDTLILVEMRQ